MNSLIKLYEEMLNNPKAHELMVDSTFNEETRKRLDSTTPEQQIEFDEYVQADIEAQLAKLSCNGGN